MPKRHPRNRRARRSPHAAPLLPPPVSREDAALFAPLVQLLLKFAPGADVRDLTELDEILGYFASNAPDDFAINAGVLFRKPNGGSYLVAQCFLNAAGELGCDRLGRPYGRFFRTHAFDNGLQDIFGQEDLIIFT